MAEGKELSVRSFSVAGTGFLSDDEMMESKREKELILSDTPLFDPKDDSLGYGEFAKHLCKSILQMSPEDGFVMAVYGAWGSGKTTLLNFVQHELKQQSADQEPIVIEFNPWWFSDDESLIRSFFNQLEVNLSGDGVRLDALRQRMADLADVLAGLPSIPWYPSNSLIRKLVVLVGWALQKRAKKVDVVGLKALIAKDLLAYRHKIVVVIDDIDRLTGSEIRQLFRTIKAVGNFPYVTYLLAFDKEVVENALEDVQKGLSGRQYLEKIVQVPLPLPMPEPGSVHKMLTDRLDALIVDTPEQYWQPDRWALTFSDSIRLLIQTPRDVIRLINLLQLTYPDLDGDVNPVDFIGINLISIIRPEMYDLVRHNKDMFVGEAHDSSRSRYYQERDEQFHTKWRDDIPAEQREPVLHLMESMFPRLQAVFGNTHHMDDDWETRLRICHPNVFDLYFRLTLSSAAMANSEIQAMLETAKKQAGFEDSLRSLLKQKQPDGSTRLRLFLERLEAYTSDVISEEQIPQIVKAFLNIGDELSPKEDEPRGMFGFDNRMRIVRLLHQLTRRLSEQDRFDLLKEAVTNGAALDLIVYEVGLKGQELKKKEDLSESAITQPQVEELKQIVVDKIREAANNGALAELRAPRWVLLAWHDWANAEEPQKWTAEFMKTDQHLMMLLEGFSQRVKSGQMDTGLISEHVRIDPKWMEPFVDTSTLIERVRRIADDKGYSDDQRAIAKRFVKEYEIRERGLDPENPLAERELNT